MASRERTRCWRWPILPVTPFITIPIVRRAIHPPWSDSGKRFPEHTRPAPRIQLAAARVTAVATLVEVAARAGVSPATASRILSGSDKPVSEPLRKRVLAAAEALHYVPNAHAQRLARATPTEVGVVVHDVSDPYFAEITRGLQRVATDAGRLLFICNSYRDPAREREYIALLHSHRTAAIVLA